jgi:hypothetical protein
MTGKIIQPIDIFVKTESLNFWWSVYGLEPSYSEDVTLYFRDKNGVKIIHSTGIITRGFFRTFKEIGGDIVHLREECAPFNRTLDDLLNATTILYGYHYDSPHYHDFHEVEFEAKRNSQGVKPSYIEIFHPAEEMNI